MIGCDAPAFDAASDRTAAARRRFDQRSIPLARLSTPPPRPLLHAVAFGSVRFAAFDVIRSAAPAAPAAVCVV